MTPTIYQAIKSLVPNTPAYYVDNGVITGWDVSEVKAGAVQPTEAEITAEVTRLQAEYDSQAYARSRKHAYDQLNQFEMQFDDAANGTTTWIDAINAIKQEFPK